MNTRTIGYILLALVLLVEVPRFFGAYDAIDPNVFGLPLTAIGTGIALPLGAGYVFHTWWKSKRQRKDWLLVWVAVLLIMEPFILVPWCLSRLWAEPLAAVLGHGIMAVLWAVVVIVSPFAMTGAVVTGLAFQKDGQHDAGSEPAVARSPASRLAFACKAPCCTWQGATQAALNAHQKAHRNGRRNLNKKERIVQHE